jgi:hypothetical protein
MASSSSTVRSAATSGVLHDDGTKGTFPGAFVTSGSGGVDHPRGLTFGPDGKVPAEWARTEVVDQYWADLGSLLASALADDPALRPIH